MVTNNKTSKCKKPSVFEIVSLRKILVAIHTMKAVPQSLCNRIISSDSIPKYVKRAVEFYDKYQRGGENLKTNKNMSTQNFASFKVVYGSTNEPIKQYLLDFEHEIGSGANGSVYKTGDSDVVLKVMDLVERRYVYQVLIQKLPRIFETVKSDEVYKEIMVSPIQPYTLAYTMSLLEPIPTTNAGSMSVMWFKMILGCMMKATSDMHRKGILHLDMKVDNVMMSPLATKSDPKALIQNMKTNMKVIDYDGCILEDDDVSACLQEGFDLHPTTPVFAHPYLLGKLFNIDTMDDIEQFRNANCGHGVMHIISHERLHNLVFGDLHFDDVFTPTNELAVRKILKYCDCYSLTVSWMVHQRMTNSSITEECEDEAVILLKKVATALGLIAQRNGGRKYKQGGTASIAEGQLTTGNIQEVDDEYLAFGLGGVQHIESINKEPSSNAASASTQTYVVVDATDVNDVYTDLDVVFYEVYQ